MKVRASLKKRTPLSSTTSLTLYVQLGVNDEILCSTLNVLLLY